MTIQAFAITYGAGYWIRVRLFVRVGYPNGYLPLSVRFVELLEREVTADEPRAHVETALLRVFNSCTTNVREMSTRNPKSSRRLHGPT